MEQKYITEIRENQNKLEELNETSIRVERNCEALKIEIGSISNLDKDLALLEDKKQLLTEEIKKNQQKVSDLKYQSINYKDNLTSLKEQADLLSANIEKEERAVKEQEISVEKLNQIKAEKESMEQLSETMQKLIEELQQELKVLEKEVTEGSEQFKNSVNRVNSVSFYVTSCQTKEVESARFKLFREERRIQQLV